MAARDKTYTVLRRLAAVGLDKATFEHAETLRRAELTLQRWGEQECGDSNDHSSWSIERDETTSKPYRCVYPYKGETRRYPVPDKERGALARVRKVCEEIGAHFFHQSDPRGCTLYVAAEPLTDTNYTRGAACCGE